LANAAAARTGGRTAETQNEERGALIRANILRALKDHYGD